MTDKFNMAERADLLGAIPLAITAPLRYGGGSANTNSSAINKQCAYRQVSASNPPLILAASRYRQCRGSCKRKRIDKGN